MISDDLKPRKFRQLPVIVEAMQFLPDDPRSLRILALWLTSHDCDFVVDVTYTSRLPYLDILMPDGRATAEANDWIIRDTEGEFHPCSPRDLALYYEEMPS